MKYFLLIFSLLAFFISATAAESGEQEIRTKSKRSGWLGVGIQDVTPRFAREHELKIKEGAYVNDIVDDSPADSAGIKEGDVVVEFNGKKIETAEDLSDAVRETKPGTKATVKILRNNENKSLSVTVGKNKMRTPYAISIPRAPKAMIQMFGSGIEGLELMELNKQLGEYFDVPNGKGVLVKSVEKDENGAKAGIKAGDVIIKIGEESISDMDDVWDAVGEYEEGEKAPVELIRKGKKSTVTLEISENDGENKIFWRNSGPGQFHFQMAPHLDKIHKELDMRMHELPRKQKELESKEAKLRTRGV